MDIAQTDCCYELRFAALGRHARSYAFPCDADGHVLLDALSERQLANYLFARAVVGRELLAPRVVQLGCFAR
ncbi:MAG: hypothetical protein J0L58_05150 [Burkholderiales bacterium]|uniref:hypothetical protein n=1 Tax=Inhella sp. TaxID=1921806 RepID=UPI001AC3B14B|nr:hypothetical protein [Burkholderiales bacterium]